MYQYQHNQSIARQYNEADADDDDESSEEEDEDLSLNPVVASVGVVSGSSTVPTGQSQIPKPPVTPSEPAVNPWGISHPFYPPAMQQAQAAFQQRQQEQKQEGMQIDPTLGSNASYAAPNAAGPYAEQQRYPAAQPISLNPYPPLNKPTPEQSETPDPENDQSESMNKPLTAEEELALIKSKYPSFKPNSKLKLSELGNLRLPNTITSFSELRKQFQEGNEALEQETLTPLAQAIEVIKPPKRKIPEIEIDYIPVFNSSASTIPNNNRHCEFPSKWYLPSQPTDSPTSEKSSESQTRVWSAPLRRKMQKRERERRAGEEVGNENGKGEGGRQDESSIWRMAAKVSVDEMLCCAFLNMMQLLESRQRDLQNRIRLNVRIYAEDHHIDIV